jgi:hypothetical protein
MTSGIFLIAKGCFNPRLMQALIILVLINIWLNNFRMQLSPPQGQDIRQVDDAPRTSGSSLSSGVGLVTTDGAWGDNGKHKYDRQDIKILGFTDRNYLPIAKLWYSRLSILVSFFARYWWSIHPLVLAAHRTPKIAAIEPIFSSTVPGIYGALCCGQRRVSSPPRVCA